MKVLTVEQAVEEVFSNTISPQLLYQEIRQGKIPHVKMGKNRILLDKDMLEKWWQEKLAESVQPKQTAFGSLRKITE